MKKVIRLSAMVMVLLMTLTLFVGCGEDPAPSSDPSSSVPGQSEGPGSVAYEGNDLDNIKAGLFDFGGMTITYADPYGKTLEPGLNRETDLLIERIQKLKDNWNANVEFIMVNADDYWDNMVTAVMGGNPYGDMLFGFPWMMTDWIAAGTPRDISPLVAELNLNLDDGTYTKMVLEDNTIGNKLFGISRGYDELYYSLVYNPKMLAEAGLEDPNALIARGAKWDFATLREYGQKLTKLDSTGEKLTLGLAASGVREIMGSFVVSNDAEIVRFDENGMPSFTLGESKGLEALQFYQDMAFTDGSLENLDWQAAADGLLNSEVGMYICEEWVLDYIQATAVENGQEDCYALTYFPRGPQASAFYDVGYGGNSQWIPSTIADDRAKAALACYCALYFPDNTLSKEEAVRQRAEELFADEASADVYVDIIMNERSRSNRIARMGLREIIGYVCEDLYFGSKTPQSAVEEYSAEIAGLLTDSGYVKALTSQ